MSRRKEQGGGHQGLSSIAATPNSHSLGSGSDVSESPTPDSNGAEPSMQRFAASPSGSKPGRASTVPRYPGAGFWVLLVTAVAFMGLSLWSGSDSDFDLVRLAQMRFEAGGATKPLTPKEAAALGRVAREFPDFVPSLSNGKASVLFQDPDNGCLYFRTNHLLLTSVGPSDDEPGTGVSAGGQVALTIFCGIDHLSSARVHLVRHGEVLVDGLCGKGEPSAEVMLAAPESPEVIEVVVEGMEGGAEGRMEPGLCPLRIWQE